MSDDHPVSGLVLGRFQPLHPGHLSLIDTAMRQCNEVVVCIGSAQRAEPFSIEQRHGLLQHQLQELYPTRAWRIVDLIDPQPMSIWPAYVSEHCQLTGARRVFYRADRLDASDEAALIGLGYSIRYVPRISFFYLFPDQIYRSVSSATQIKAWCDRLGAPLVASR